MKGAFAMNTFVRIFWIITSILMILVGVYCLINPGAALLSVAWLLGISVLLDGISAVVYYFNGGKEIKGGGWILFDGIVSIILGFIVTFSNVAIVMADFLPLFFSVWIILKGIFTFCHAFHFKGESNSCWWVFLIVGIIMVLIGLATFINPILGIITIATIVGVYFILSGIYSLFQCFVFKNL